MDKTKTFLASKTLWGSAATILGMLLPALGVGASPTEISHALDSLSNGINDLLTFGGIVLTIYGRWTARHALTVTKA